MTFFERMQKITSLKKQLQDLDFKTQKNIEYDKTGLPIPYSWADIHKEKEALRVQINALQGGTEM